MLDEALGKLHRPDEVDLEDPPPMRVIGLTERRMRPADPGIAEENVERLAIELPRERLDGRVIRHVKLEDLDHAPDRSRLSGAVGIEAGRQHAKSVLGVLTRELDAEAGVATGNQNGGHGQETSKA
jgi:hypothetical protein